MVKNASITKDDWYNNNINLFFHNETPQQNELKATFYFRTPYRNESEFSIQALSRQENPTESNKLKTLNTNNATVSENYQRLVSKKIQGLYDGSNDSKTVGEYSGEIKDKINKSLNNVLEDLKLTSLGNPLINGSFYFEKGISKDFDYKNLSAGEKSVFDLILDLIIKSEYYPDAIFCIDEPESHIHTKIQSALLAELYRLIPESSQLWIATHSIGMLTQAQKLESENPNSVVFLNFDDKDFDTKVSIEPSKIDKTLWNKFLEITLSDFSKLIGPAQIVFCEGAPYTKQENESFDAKIYTKIFEKNYPQTQFISIGSCRHVEDLNNPSIKMISNVVSHQNIIKIIDRDARTLEEIEECKGKGINVLSKRNLECYLLDDEVIKLLCKKHNKNEKIDICLNKKQEALKNKNPIDDLKKIKGEMDNFLKTELEIIEGGSNTNSFLLYTMAPLITEDTEVYKLLKKDIFGDD